MKRSVLRSLVFKVLILLVFAFSCGLSEEKEDANSEQADLKSRGNCYKLAERYDECVYDICDSIRYSCKVCSCMKSDGNNCVYSAHRKLDDCTEEENEEAEYMLDYVYCSEYLEGFERLCPPPETNVCNKEYDYCITHSYENGICVPLVNGGNICSNICTSVGSSVECYSNQEACYPFGNKGVCMKAGSIKEGEMCAYTNDCEQGNVCLENEAEKEYRCYRVCKNSSSCGVNKICIDTELGYSVCINQ